MRYDLESEPERKKPAPAEQPAATREQFASAIGNNAMARMAASPKTAPAPVLARFSGVDLAQRPTGALAEEAPATPEGPHETPPAAGSAPAEGHAAEPETLEPVEEAEPGNYNAEEESYI